jgi:hypothetical protein
VTVSDSPMARNLFRQSKKVGCEGPHYFRDMWKNTGKNTEEDDMWKKQLIFRELPYWKDYDVRYSIDVMHVEKNVCESLLETLLNTDGKTRDHGHA